MKKLSLLVVILVCFGCKESVFKQNIAFPDNQWKRNDPQSFTFTIKKKANYEILVLYRHIYGIPFREIPLSVTYSASGATTETKPFTLTIADEQGNTLSDCIGDICDIEVKLTEGELAPGEYTVTLANTFDHEYLPNTPSVGIKVVHAD